MGRERRYTITIDVPKEEMIDWVACNCDPEEVFYAYDLDEWAEKMGGLRRRMTNDGQ